MRSGVQRAAVRLAARRLAGSRLSRVGFPLGFHSGCPPALAIALGLRQSLWESMQGRLRVPLASARLAATDLRGQACRRPGRCYLVCASLPVLLYAWWAAIPGNACQPVRVVDDLARPGKSGSTVTAVYLAAFLCGIRPAHWLWSRLWPLIATAVAVLLIQSLPWWPILGIAAILVLDAALVAGILGVAEKRDFS